MNDATSNISEKEYKGIKKMINSMAAKETPSIRRVLLKKAEELFREETSKGIFAHPREQTGKAIPSSDILHAPVIQAKLENHLKNIKEQQHIETQRKTFSKGHSKEFLNKQDQYTLIKQWREEKNERARDRLILAFDPMIKTMAYEAHKRSGMPIDDLQNEARVALIRSLNLFDPDKGNSLSTFALRPIQGALARYIMDMSGVCRIGSNAADIKVWRKFSKVRSEIEHRLNRPIGPEDYADIAEKIGVKTNVIERMIPRIMRKDMELDAPTNINEQDSGSRMDMLSSEDEQEEPTFDARDTNKAMRIIRSTIKQLPEREQYIINNRLLSDEPMHFKLIGDRYNVSKERIRQIEMRAVGILRDALEKEGVTSNALFR